MPNNDNLQQALNDYIATWNSGKRYSDSEIFEKFPEFNNDPNILKAANDYIAIWDTGKYKDPSEMNGKFPELFPPVKKKVSSESATTYSQGTSPALSPLGLQSAGSNILDIGKGDYTKIPQVTKEKPVVVEQKQPKQEQTTGIPKIKEPEFLQETTPFITKRATTQAYNLAQKGDYEKSSEILNEVKINDRENDYAYTLSAHNNQQLASKTNQPELLNTALDDINTAIGIRQQKNQKDDDLLLVRADILLQMNKPITAYKDIEQAEKSMAAGGTGFDDGTLEYQRKKIDNTNQQINLSKAKAKVFFSVGDGANANKYEQQAQDRTNDVNAEQTEYARRGINKSLLALTDYIQEKVDSFYKPVYEGAEKMTEGAIDFTKEFYTKIGDIANDKNKSDSEKIFDMFLSSTSVNNKQVENVAKVGSGAMELGMGTMMFTPAGAVFYGATEAGSLISPEAVNALMQPITLMTQPKSETGKFVAQMADYAFVMFLMGATHKLMKGSDVVESRSRMTGEETQYPHLVVDQMQKKQYVDIAEKIKNAEPLTETETQTVQQVFTEMPKEVLEKGTELYQNEIKPKVELNDKKIKDEQAKSETTTETPTTEATTETKLPEEKVVTTEPQATITTKVTVKNIKTGKNVEFTKSEQGEWLTEDGKKPTKFQQAQIEKKIEKPIEYTGVKTSTDENAIVNKPDEIITEMKGKKTAVDFDNTVFAPETEALTSFGNKIKEQIENGDDIEVITNREDTPINRKQISELLGIGEDKINFAKDATDKGRIAKEKGIEVFLDNKQENVDAVAKQGIKSINVNEPILDIVQFKQFSDIVSESKTPQEAFDKISKIKDIPQDVSLAFKEKYDPNGNLTPQQAFEKFYNEVKGVSVGGKITKFNIPEATGKFDVVEKREYKNIEDNKFKPRNQLKFNQGDNYKAVRIIAHVELIDLIRYGSELHRNLTGKLSKASVLPREYITKLEKKYGITANDAWVKAKQFARENRDANIEQIIILGDKIQPIKKISEGVSEGIKPKETPKTYEQKAKVYADKIRNLKTKPLEFRDENGNVMDITTMGTEWNTVVENIAKGIELLGKDIDNAVAVSKMIKNAVKDFSFYNKLSEADKLKFEEQIKNEYLKDDFTKEAPKDETTVSPIIRKKGIYDVMANILPEKDFKEWEGGYYENLETGRRKRNLQEAVERLENESQRSKNNILIDKVIKGKEDLTLAQHADILAELGKRRTERDNLIDDKLNGNLTHEEYKKLVLEKDKQIVEASDAARIIGTLASDMLGIRGEINYEAGRTTIDRLQKEYAASSDKQVKDLTKEELSEISNHYDKIVELGKTLENTKNERFSEIDKEIADAEKKQMQDKIDELYSQLQKALKDVKDKSEQKQKGYERKISEGKDALKKYARQFSANPFFDPEFYTALRKIATGHIEKFYNETKTKIQVDALIKKTLKEAQEIIPELSEKDIRDAITGNYKKPTRSKTELQTIKEDLKKEIKALEEYSDEFDMSEMDELGKLKAQDKSKNQRDIEKQLEKLRQYRKGKFPEKKVRKEDIPIIERLKKEQKAEIEKNKEQYKEERWRKASIKRKQNALAEVRRKINNKEFSTKEQEWRKYDLDKSGKSEQVKKLIDKEIQTQRLLDSEKIRWRIERKRNLLRDEHPAIIMAETVNDIVRFNNLTYLGTFAKLGGALAWNLLLLPKKAIQQYAVSLVTPKYAKRFAGEYGKIPLKDVGAFYADAGSAILNMGNFLKRKWAESEPKGVFGTIKTGIFGRTKLDNLSKIGETSHAAIKHIVQEPYFKLAEKMLKREAGFNYEEAVQKLKSSYLTESQRKYWENVKSNNRIVDGKGFDPNVLARIAKQAEDYSAYQIYLNKNKTATKIKNIINPTSVGGKVAKKLLWDNLFTIVTVPANYVSRYIYNRVGAALQSVTGSITKTAIADNKRVPGLPEVIANRLLNKDYLNKFTPEQLKGVQKNLTGASSVAIALVAGYALKDSVTYNKDKKEYEVDGSGIPSKLLHYHTVENIISNAMFLKSIEEQGGDVEKYLFDYLESDAKQIMSMPFISQLQYSYLGTATELASSLKSIDKDKTKEKFAQLVEKISAQYISMYLMPPGFIKEIAKWTDERVKNGQNVYPKDFMDYIYINYPYLRQFVGIDGNSSISSGGSFNKSTTTKTSKTKSSRQSTIKER